MISAAFTSRGSRLAVARLLLIVVPEPENIEALSTISHPDRTCSRQANCPFTIYYTPADTLGTAGGIRHWVAYSSRIEIFTSLTPRPWVE